MTLEANLESVRRKIAAVELATGRHSGSVRLVAVSKTHPAEEVKAAFDAGQKVFGENYATEMVEKQKALADLGVSPTFHFIGRIQSNKIRLLVGRTELIHSVDRVKLVRMISDAAAALGIVQPIMLEAHLSEEESKGGATPADLPALVEAALAAPAVSLSGLMTMPPYFEDPEMARPIFSRLRQLMAELASSYALPGFTELSMGMSNDFEVAIQEGATLVRIGTAIFGPRP